MSDWRIEAKNRILYFDLRLLWSYRDLLLMFIKRDIVTVYKQTILGPVWYVAQPILTTVIYMFVFGNIAGISTDGLPQPLFYFSGVIVWNYFSECFTTTSITFNENQKIFGKVYFPRLIVPFSKAISALIKFFIQFGFFLILYFYYAYTIGLSPNLYVFLMPFIISMVGLLGLGLGILFTSITAKYRDLVFLLQFGIQLLMFATPIIYPLSILEGLTKKIVLANPLSPLIEAFRLGWLGTGSFDWLQMAYSVVIIFFFFFFGMVVFQKAEKNFIDTV